MNPQQILSLIRAHGHECFLVRGDVVATEVFTQNGETHYGRKTFADGTPRADVLAWLGY